MRATALTEPGPVDQRRLQPASTPAARSTPAADPHKNWTETRGPVTDYFQPGLGLEIEVSELYGRPWIPTTGLKLVGFS